MTIDRISPEQAARDMQTEGVAILLCAYAEPGKCRQYRLDKSVPLNEFESQQSDLPRGRKLLVYCACPGDATAVNLAGKLAQDGFENVWVIAGGYEAFRKADATVQAG